MANIIISSSVETFLVYFNKSLLAAFAVQADWVFDFICPNCGELLNFKVEKTITLIRIFCTCQCYFSEQSILPYVRENSSEFHQFLIEMIKHLAIYHYYATEEQLNAKNNINS